MDIGLRHLGLQPATALTFGTGSPVSFYAPLTTTLVPSFAAGSNTPTFTRATTAMVEDHEGILRQVPSGAARFHGARVVVNEASNTRLTGGTDGSPGTAPTGYVYVSTGGVATYTDSDTFQGHKKVKYEVSNNRHYLTWTARRSYSIGDKFIVRIHVTGVSGSTNVTQFFSMAVAGFSITSFTIDGVAKNPTTEATEPGWWELKGTITTGGGAAQHRIGVGCSANMTGHFEFDYLWLEVNVEEAYTGYDVTIGVESAPFHGAGADGVKYFSTDKDGNPIPDATLKGYLAEGARQNLCLQSQDFSSVSWARNGILAFGSGSTVDATTAPDGSTTADLITESSTNTYHLAGSQTLTHTTATQSVYVKNNGANYVALRHRSGTGQVVTCVFNLLTGAVTQTTNQGTTYSGVSSTITNVGNDWYRISLTSTRASGSTGFGIDFCNSATPTLDTDGTVIYVGTGTAGAYLWGAQVETATFAASYIPTTTAAVTRNLDILSFVGSNNVSPSIGSSFAQVTVPSENTSTGSMLSGATDRNYLYKGNSGNQIGTSDGTSNRFGALWANDGVTRKAASSWGPAGRSVSLNGNTSNSPDFDGTIELSGAGFFYIGTNSTSMGTITYNKNVRFWTTQLSDAQLTALTA